MTTSVMSIIMDKQDKSNQSGDAHPAKENVARSSQEYTQKNNERKK